MINRERLAELRKAIMDHSIKTMCGSDHPCRYDPMELFDTIDKLLTVKEAAEGVAHSIAGTVGTKTNSELPEWFRLRLQDLNEALAAVNEDK